MQRLLLLVLLTLTTSALFAQGLSYTCTRTYEIGCGTPCVSITASIPDIRSSTASYRIGDVTPVQSCYPLVDPGGPGPSANLTIDDRYSASIPITFPFSFYGTTYNNLLVSTNGYISFDASLAGTYSHYQNLGDLPDADYDGALVMGPYHDLNPAENTSPNQKVKYNVYGNAPNRKWILSFYKNPLFDCDNLIENTHQIILHESSGVIEVYIKDMEICTSWINGKAMVGLQNMAKNQGITAPNRRMSDPAWGSIGMNEMWRFVPNTGASAFIGPAQLVDLDDGSVVSTSDTSRIDINNLGLSFPNVCVPANTTKTYVVRTQWQSAIPGGGTYFSNDTIIVNRVDGLPLSTSSTQTLCGQSTGTITVTASGGTPPYQYSIDLGPYQSSGTFTGLPLGTYTIIGMDATGCSDTTTVDVTSISDIPGAINAMNTGCPGVSNGSVTVTPGGGTAPYTYSLNGGPSQTSNTFGGLGAGSYTVVFTDVNGCSGTVSGTVNEGTSLTLSFTTIGTSCPGVNDGQITVTPTSGTGPYEYSVDGGPFQSSNILTGLASGAHTITIRDASGCTGTRNAFLNAGSGVVANVIPTNATCVGVNNGSLTVNVFNGTAPYSYAINGGTPQSSNVFTGLAAGTYSVTFSDASGCTNTVTSIIGSGTGITGSGTAQPTACAGVSNGSITLTPGATGTAPFEFSIDGGTTFQSTGTFTGLAQGTYNYVIRDANGCSYSNTLNVAAGTNINATSSQVATSCPGVNNGSVTVTPTNGTAPYEYSIDGGVTYQTSNTFNNLADGPHTITVRDASGCTGTVNATVNAGTPIGLTATATPAACATASNGSITATATSGTAPYQFSIDGGVTYQASATFTNLLPDDYTITIRDVNGCTGTFNITVTAGTPFTVSASTTPAACGGSATGSVSLTPTGGAAPYQYSIDGGTTMQASNEFLNLVDGNYSFMIIDGFGCVATVDATVASGSTYTGTATTTPTACSGISTGTIEVTPTGGTAPYEYSLDGTTYQSSNILANVGEGTFTVYIRDANGCVGTLTATVAAGTSLTGNTASTTATCTTAPDGSLTVTATSGVAPYEYSLDGVTFQTSNVFTGLLPDNYTITIRDDLGCTGVVSGTVNAGSGLSGTSTHTPTSCTGVDNGTITVTPDAGLGLAPFTYSLDGGAAQASNIFTAVSAGTHNIIFTDANGCTGTVTEVVAQGTNISGTADPIATSCAGVDNGSVLITPDAIGTAPFTYSLNGGAAQNSNSFTGLAAGAYSVLITDANGCTATVSFNVSVGAGFVATATPVDAACPGVDNGGVTITTVDGTAPFTYSLNGGAAQASNTFNGLAATTHSVLVTDANGCTYTVSFTIGQGSGVVANYTQEATACPGVANGTAEITPLNGTAPYNYSINGGASQASNIFTGLAAGTHTVTINDATGCTGTLTITIDEGAVITGTASSDPTSCPGVANGTITVTAGSNSTAPYQYALDGGANQASQTFTSIAEGAHTVIITDANGCVSDPINVTVTTGAPITGVAEGINTTCPGVDDGIVTLVSSTGTAPYTYSINGGAAQASNVFTGLPAGTHTVTFTDVNGCSGTASVTLTTGSGISSTIDAVATSCPDVNNGTVTLTPTSGTAPYTYSINGGAFQASPTFINLAPGAYTVEVRDALGCSGDNNITVTQGQVLNSDVVPTQPLCADINDGVIVVNPTSGQAPYTYTLNGGTAQSSNTFSNLAPGAYTIAFTDAIGCTGTNSQTLTTNAPIVLDADSIDPLCFGSADGTITITATGGVPTYSYSLNGGAYQTSNVFDGLAQGTYTIRVKDDVDCVKDITVSLSQPAALTATAATTAPSTCAGGDGVIEVTGTGGTAPYTYSVDNAATYPFQTSPNFNVATGTYNNIAVKDDNGCIAISASVFVDEIDNMFLTLGADTTICEGSSYTFDPQTNDETSVFTWTPAQSIADPNVKFAVASPVDTTTYILHAQWGACSRTDTLTVNVLLKPIPNAGSDVRICLNDSTIISGTVSHTSGPVTLTWSPADLVQDPNSPTTMAVPNGTQMYVLTATDQYGCNFDVKDSVLVIMQPEVPAYAGGDTMLVINQNQNLMGSGGVDYLWSTPSSGVQILNPTAQSPTVILQNDARFFVRVIDIAGCVGYDTVYVQVYQGPDYMVPNAFTPNGDGLNDVFRVIPVGMTTPEYFRVFNRYGQVVFETNQYMKGWDGTYKGKVQQTGTYIWMLKGKDKNGRTIEMKGTVLLIN